VPASALALTSSKVDKLVGTLDALANWMQADYDRYGAIVKELKITAD
jgi:hypothetical protein